REHRGRLALDAAGGGDDRGHRLRHHQGFRDGVAGASGRDRDRAGAGLGRVRAPDSTGRSGARTVRAVDVLATVVDTGALLRTVAAALVAGVGVTLMFSLAILGATRFAEMNGDGRPVAAASFGALAIVGPVAAAARGPSGVVCRASAGAAGAG